LLRNVGGSARVVGFRGGPKKKKGKGEGHNVEKQMGGVENVTMEGRKKRAPCKDSAEKQQRKRNKDGKPGEGNNRNKTEKPGGTTVK